MFEESALVVARNLAEEVRTRGVGARVSQEQRVAAPVALVCNAERAVSHTKSSHFAAAWEGGLSQGGLAREHR